MDGGKAWDREGYAVVRAAQAEGGRVPEAQEPPAPLLPALDQVTRWSKADRAKPPHCEQVALFGGWRLTDWEERGPG